MSIRIALDHTTIYSYDKPVTLDPHIVRLRPAPHCRTSILSYSLNVKPDTHFLNWQQDPFGNYLARLVFPELAPYLVTSNASAMLQTWLKKHRPGNIRIIDALVQINQAVQQDVEYQVRMEPGVQSSEQTLTRAKGSCRDSGWLLVEILRHYGLAARFVSGYLVQLVPDVKSLDGPSGASADFTDLHAWAEVYIPGAGWVGLASMNDRASHFPMMNTLGTMFSIWAKALMRNSNSRMYVSPWVVSQPLSR